jgi:eukaryotic-like serine/threonine-protein kinase
VKVDRYELREKLGHGTTGTAYRAHDPKLNREVVVKILTSGGDDSARRRRFAREARALASLHHPNIIEMLDFGVVPGGPFYLVTEYVGGADLARLVQEHGPLPEPVLVAIGLELCAALAHAHGHGIIHRALKPANVYLDRGRLVLTEFGIVKAFRSSSPLGDDAAHTITAVVGVPGFVSPEQLKQQDLDGRTDLFALGTLLYYLAARRLPFEAETHLGLHEQLLNGRPAPLLELRPDVSRELALVVHRCLEPERDRRPESAHAVRTALQRLLEQHGHRDAREILQLYERDPSLEDFAWSVPTASDTAEQAAILTPRAGQRRMRPWLAVALIGIAGVAAIVFIVVRLSAPTPKHAPAPPAAEAQAAPPPEEATSDTLKTQR